MRTRLASKTDATIGSFCTRLLGELDCRGEKTPSPRTGAAYIGLGEVCLTPNWLCFQYLIYMSIPNWSIHSVPHLHASFTYLHLIGHAFSSSFTYLRPGTDSSKTLLHMRILVVYPNTWVVASGHQRHLVMVYVASHISPF